MKNKTLDYLQIKSVKFLQESGTWLIRFIFLVGAVSLLAQFAAIFVESEVFLFQIKGSRYLLINEELYDVEARTRIKHEIQMAKK